MKLSEYKQFLKEKEITTHNWYRSRIICQDNQRIIYSIPGKQSYTIYCFDKKALKKWLNRYLMWMYIKRMVRI